MKTRMLAIALFALLSAGSFHPAFAGITASFRFALSNFAGPVPSQWAKLAVDRERNEIYALNQRKNEIRIFNEFGMEIYDFGEGFASASDLAVGDDGDIFILTRGYQTSAVNLCNYRGELLSEITPENVPPGFSGFQADRIEYEQGLLYLVDSGALRIMVLDAHGFFRKGYDVKDILRRSSAAVKELAERDRRGQRTLDAIDREERRIEDLAMNGFDVDGDGNMLFTVPSIFSAFRLSPDGELAEFGRPGSGPGKFGVTAGIVADDMGHIYVSDRLRCVVLVFDHNFRFQTEFGYRGGGPSNLIVPDDLAIDGQGNIYVAQAANRGVSVFRVVYERATETGVEW